MDLSRYKNKEVCINSTEKVDTLLAKLVDAEKLESGGSGFDFDKFDQEVRWLIGKVKIQEYFVEKFQELRERYVQQMEMDNINLLGVSNTSKATIHGKSSYIETTPKKKRPRIKKEKIAGSKLQLHSKSTVVTQSIPTRKIRISNTATCLTRPRRLPNKTAQSLNKQQNKPSASWIVARTKVGVGINKPKSSLQVHKHKERRAESKQRDKQNEELASAYKAFSDGLPSNPNKRSASKPNVFKLIVNPIETNRRRH